MATRASAQLTQRPQWAVIPFSSKKDSGNAYGAAAAQAVYDELAKRVDTFRPPIDVLPLENVSRVEGTLGLTDPITDETSIIRLGQELHATRIVTGEIVDTKITTIGGNRQADVLVSITVKDVASGVNINGASVQAFSTLRAANTPREALIKEALGIAANKAVGSIQAQSLPTGTLLNTTNDIGLVNQGSRSGFKSGQHVIVTRGREEVATAHVLETDFDSSQIRIDRSIKGLAPGDKVSVIFEPPSFVDIGPNDTPRVAQSHNHGNNSGIISAVLILGLAAVLLGGKGNNGQSAASQVTAEATTNAGVPANKITWSTVGFFRFSGVAFAWQIYRGIDEIPDGVTNGDNTHFFFDTTASRSVTYYAFPPGSATSTACATQPAPVVVTSTGVTPGTPFNYRVELVFQVSSLDLPGGGSTTTTTSGGTTSTTGGGTIGGGTSSTTGGGTIGGGTTSTTGGGTTSTTGGGTTSGTGGTLCYFLSSQTSSTGVATALFPPTLGNPGNGAVLSVAQPFTFSSDVPGSFVGEYILQISGSPVFTGKVVTLGPLDTSQIGTLSITADPNAIFFGFAGPLWWRVGARNTADFPGPVKDPATKARYIFSATRSFTRPTIPPGPPGG